MKARFQSRATTISLGIGVVLIWSTCFVTIKLSSLGNEPLTFAAIRALLAGIVLLILSTLGGCLKPPSNTWPWLAVSALTGTSLALWGMFGSVPIEGSVIASILGNSQAILIAPLAVIFLNEKQTLWRWMCLGIGFLGLLLVIVGKSEGVGTLGGSLIALLASVGLAISSLVAKRLSGQMHALTLTTWQFLLGSIPLVVAAIIFERPYYFRPTDKALWSLIYLAVISSAGGSFIWNWLLKRIDVTSLTALTMLGPPTSLLLGLFIFDERVTMIQWAGITIALVSVTCLQWSEDPSHHDR
ncbi:EamA family transporter [Bacteriovorax sp. PP10]|uniref:EamA family transporter n=1 Tax=Bacteriovorax antarcticus TaxID=3088717 RepID=A0ABU5VZV2_9BACT|nr:EamA family transporter [Bacteriovorax sp. PP10]MEA9358482.1 EamA family transporter [Bacteriovorax sp. PP10]